MVVGPALPEVNPVQRARLAALAALGRDAAFDRVYRIPGMQKVNQALGPAGARARASARGCSCTAGASRSRATSGSSRRNTSSGRRILEDDDLAAWLGSPR